MFNPAVKLETENDQIWQDASILAAANIVPATGLATDYLNVFNEAIMLFGLLPEMPDMIDELLVWQPLTYEQHFVRSGFAAKDLAIAAYQNARQDIKVPFDTLSEATGTLLAHAIVKAEALIKAKAEVSLGEYVQETLVSLESAILTLDGLIHGGAAGGAQDDIDALFD
jgi:hypothetical protein